MRFFSGTYSRNVDEKKRLQLPEKLRSAIDSEKEGEGLMVQLGEFPKTLALYTVRRFEELAARIGTERMPDEAARRFELQFYGTAEFVDIDKQGRIVLPDRLIRKAGLENEVVLVGQRNRIEVWSRTELDRQMGIDWEGDAWPDWPRYIRSESKREE